jgi:alpha-galactosidase
MPVTEGSRALECSVNGAAAALLNMGGGSLLLPQSSLVPVAPNVGNNAIALLNPSGYGADLDRIVISGDGQEPAPTFTTYEAEGAQLAGTAGFSYSTRASGGAYVGSFGACPANTIPSPSTASPLQLPARINSKSTMSPMAHAKSMYRSTARLRYSSP